MRTTLPKYILSEHDPFECVNHLCMGNNQQSCARLGSASALLKIDVFMTCRRRRFHVCRCDSKYTVLQGKTTRVASQFCTPTTTERTVHRHVCTITRHLHDSFRPISQHYTYADQHPLVLYRAECAVPSVDSKCLSAKANAK